MEKTAIKEEEEEEDQIWEENVDEEGEKEMRRMAIQLGLCHLAQFKEATEGKGEAEDGEEKMDIDGGENDDFDAHHRKALWSLLRAIRCLHGRHPKLAAQCFREGALYSDELAKMAEGNEQQKEIHLKLRNIFARLLYKNGNKE